MINILNRVSTTLDKQKAKILSLLEKMSKREQYMVVGTTLFLLITVVILSLSKMHSLANTEEKRLKDLKDFMSVMQKNVMVMSASSEAELSLSEKVQRISQQQGFSASFQQVGTQLQIVAEHQSYAVIANFLTQLAQVGLSIKKMELITDNNQIKLMLTVQ